MKTYLIACFLAAMALLSPNVMAAQQYSSRQLGQACGSDNSVKAECVAGLSCNSGTCQMRSFLSPASGSCIAVMKAAGFNESSYSVLNGFCYNKCPDLYGPSVVASAVMESLLAGRSPESVLLKISQLSSEDLDKFRTAVNICISCGDQCVIGSDFLGSGLGGPPRTPQSTAY